MPSGKTDPRTPFVLPSSLNLGDTVRLGSGPFMDAKVKQITETEVILLRAYVACGDFSYTAGVICTLGFEEVKFLLTSKTLLERIANGNVSQ